MTDYKKYCIMFFSSHVVIVCDILLYACNNNIKVMFGQVARVIRAYNTIHLVIILKKESGLYGSI